MPVEVFSHTEHDIGTLARFYAAKEPLEFFQVCRDEWVSRARGHDRSFRSIAWSTASLNAGQVREKAAKESRPPWVRA